MLREANCRQNKNYTKHAKFMNKSFVTKDLYKNKDFMKAKGFTKE